MTTRAERVAILDAFMAERKRIVRPDRQGTWLPGMNNDDERQLSWPLEVDGEQLPDASLMIIGYPRETVLCFRLQILCPAAVCRLDFTDETHGNPLPLLEDLPALVQGPHWHSWPINRLFFFQFDHPVRLRNAVPFDGAGRQFDAILRWFCQENNIDQPPPDHLIELPRLDTLL